MVMTLLACKSQPPTNHLNQHDLALAVAAPATGFSPNQLLSDGAMADALSFEATQIQTFFQRSPYGGSSFLSTYSSNGVRAADAIERISTRYSINPIVLLSRIQMQQGLVSESRYPTDGKRIEYLFGCGCKSPTECDAAYAGFDVQVDCFAYALRASLDAITANRVTLGGWGPGVERSTLDGITVTPENAATAALYDYDPRVGTFASDNSLFWLIFMNYSAFLGYVPPDSAPPKGTSWIGDACEKDTACAAQGGLCATNYPGGMCTIGCTTTCPSEFGRPESFCASFGDDGFCLKICNEVASSCRDGYACRRVKQFGGGTSSQAVCVPK